jgi:outer membrane protein assembly factor BamB
MPLSSLVRTARPLRPHRALLGLVPVLALVASPALPARAADASSSSSSGPASPSSQAIKSWGTAKASGKSKAQRVNAIVESNGVAYLGGEFTTMVSPTGSTASRNYLAAVDGATGGLKTWNPKASSKVWALELAADGKSVYVGGDFSKIGGRSVSRVAKVDLATGKVDTTFKPRSVKGRVRALALDGDRLYIGGEFGSVDGKSRPKIAAVDARTGALLPWTPPPLGQGRYLGQTGVPTPDYSPGHVFAIDVLGDKVFVGGTFLDLGGQAGLATLDAATGAAAEPYYDLGRPMFDLEASGGTLYAVGGGPGGRLYALDPDDDDPVWRTKVDGDNVGVAVSATTVYLAGHYDYIVSKDSSCYQFCPGGPYRHHLAAFGKRDGALLPWNPDADTSTGPFTLAIGEKALYVGGEFRNINGKSQPGFAIFPGAP